MGSLFIDFGCQVKHKQLCDSRNLSKIFILDSSRFFWWLIAIETEPNDKYNMRQKQVQYTRKNFKRLIGFIKGGLKLVSPQKSMVDVQRSARKTSSAKFKTFRDSSVQRIGLYSESFETCFLFLGTLIASDHIMKAGNSWHLRRDYELLNLLVKSSGILRHAFQIPMRVWEAELREGGKYKFWILMSPNQETVNTN